MSEMAGSFFSLKVFFILLRETFESAIIISILLSFLKQNFHRKASPASLNDDDGDLTSDNRKKDDSGLVLTIDSSLYRSLQLQVWLGALIGLLICLVIGVVFVALFYVIGENYWSKYERNWEAIFSIISSLIISIMGVSLLRINTMQKKWQTKLRLNMSKHFENQQTYDESNGTSTGARDTTANGEQTGLEQAVVEQQYENIVQHEQEILTNELGLEVVKKTHKKSFKSWIKLMTEKYSLMILPMVTLLREGLEAIFVISGVSASEPLSTLPLSMFTAITLGVLIGVFLYKGGNKMRLQIFLIGSTCFLYLVSAGLMSRGVWFLELEQYVKRCNGQDMTEVGNGPGSYDVINTIWHVNCCSGINDGGWMLLNALVGWNNTATYGSVISYNLYWLFIISLLKIKLSQERNGFLPLIPIKWQLRSIKKRYKLIKFNIDNNVNYKSTSQLYSEDNDGIELHDDNEEEPSETSTFLLNSRGTS